MKKLLLLLAGSMVALGANAQYARHTFDGMSQQHKTVSPGKTIAPARHSAARTTATPFLTENFGTGTSTTLPTGWTAGIITGPGTWHWSKVASTSAYSIGVMASTTASNGWMIFDSDSLGTVCSCAPAGWLQSPVYNCSAHTTVRLSFENYYRSFYDSCSVWVSTSPTFATYHDFPVSLNDNLTTNSSTANTSTVHINISSVAASQAAVYIRFVYYGYAGGSYSWMIDDLNLSELDPHDVGISGSFLYEPEATAYNGSIFSTPLAFVDSVYPVTLLSNWGANVETSVAVNAHIYQGATSVYNQNSTYPSLPLNAEDTVIQFPGYKPTALGNYTCAFSTTVTGDADATNNIDTATFSVTDTTWMENQGSVIGGLYCFKSAAPQLAFMNGVRFDVPSTSAGDTVSGFGVAFSSSSVPTTGSAKVSVQLYQVQQSGTSWTYMGTSVAKAILGSEISTASTIVWADFRIDQFASGGITPFILQPGYSYAAIIQVNGVTTNLVVAATGSPHATGFSGYFGQSDTSSNDGGTTFGSTIATGNPSDVPLVRMYTGKVPPPLGVRNVTFTNSIGKAYPNPANTSVNIPFTMGRDGVVTVSLSNVIGQVMQSQQINAIGGQPMNATFATNGLPAGVYVYTVEVNGGHTTGRIVITH